ncbi:MAG: DNA-binding protein WhiA [Oscillospiraceae bacterium]
MSFSAEIKRELCKTALNRKCCAQAEAYGVLLYCSSFRRDGIRIVTESEAFAARLPLLFKKAFQLEFDQLPPDRPGKRAFLITDPAKITAIGDTYGYDPGESVALHINFGVLEEDHCRTAFFRGAFLAGGSVTDPDKGYHLELVTSHYNVGREMPALLRESGFEPKSVERKANYVTYFKQSEYIEDFLTAIGSPVAAMGIMNAKVEKYLRGSVNRRVNCDAANLDKTVDAAQGQIEAIRRLEERGVLDELPDKLKEAAFLRRENPELTLTQLATLCNPPVTKSALNHRLRKLMELARQP